MFTKLYEKVISYIKEEYKFLILILCFLILATVKLPFFIDAPGGLIDLSDRIEIDGKNKFSGSLNLAYVSEIRATVPTYLLSKINKDWDLIKKDEVVLDNESLDDAKFRDKLSLDEAICNAKFAAFSRANVDFNVVNNKVFVTYIYEGAKTDIKIGDQILEVDGKSVSNVKELQSIDKKVGKTVKLKVVNNKKEYIRTAEYVDFNDEVIIGIGLSEVFDIESDYSINTSYKTRESGPSGGMMMALTLYSYLTDQDLTNGLKVVGTGTIDKNGNVGEIGGVKHKLIGAVKKKADIFFVPNGDNYDEAIKVKNEKGYDIKVVGVSTLDDVINELEK